MDECTANDSTPSSEKNTTEWNANRQPTYCGLWMWIWLFDSTGQVFYTLLTSHDKNLFPQILLNVEYMI